MEHTGDFCNICLEQAFAGSYFEIDYMSNRDEQLQAQAFYGRAVHSLRWQLC
jgi:hypothetical protein